MSAIQHRPRVLIAGLFHETNTFADGTTTLADFTTLTGDSLLDAAGDASPLGAALVQAQALNWKIIPAVDTRALPSAMVEDAVVEHFWQHFQTAAATALAANAVDGILLILHGAMVSHSFDDVEGEILRRIRHLPGAQHLPLFAVLDLHANLSAQMVRHATGFVAYRENPHTDAAQSAMRAATLLERAMRCARQPSNYACQADVILPPTGTATADEPMRLLRENADRLEAKGHWAVNVIAGFAQADTADTGVAFNIVSELPADDVHADLQSLAALALAHRNRGYPAQRDVSEVVAHIIKNPSPRPSLIVEPADNIGGGAPGDCTSVLRALLKHETQLPPTGLILCDAQAVRQLRDTAVGEKTTLELGGKGSRLDPGPVRLQVELVSTSDGTFELEDRQSHLASCAGTRIHMGPCAVVRRGNITLLLTSRATPPFDLGQWRSQGIEPQDLRIIAVKAAVAHRRAYDRIAGASYTVSTPGPCSSDLSALPYRKVRRPIAPLDPIEHAHAVRVFDQAVD